MKIEKLELKHVAPYMPYRINPLKVQHNNTIYTLEGISGAWNVELRTGMLVKDNIHVETIKPILRPLYDLIDTNVARELNDISCFNFVYDLRYKTISIETDNDIELSDMITGIDMLYANHFDVFGLIENGLAIDVNTLKP